jgi:hypothetical protein
VLACNPQPGAADAGSAQGAIGLTPCQEFLLRTCGDASAEATTARCGNRPGCVAARLTATYESAKCAADNLDLVQWPSCPEPSDAASGAEPASLVEAQTCTDLLTKVCGVAYPVTRPCETDNACVTAHEVVDGAAQGSSSAACVEALGDDTSFPRCTRH